MNQNFKDTTTADENKHLVQLAQRCKLLTQEQGQEILAKIAQPLADEQNISVLKIFEDDDYLLPSDIDFLLAVRDHLKTKLLDKKFGMLAIANQFTSSEGLEKALAEQATFFRETKKSRLIGDILVANQDITQADRSALLLTQNRVSDELLAETINELGVSEKERIDINKRFGVIAVKKGFVKIEQVNQALKQQLWEVQRGKKQRYLGEILEESAALTKDEIIAILKEQRVLEKQRLNLEKALSLNLSDFKMNQRLDRLFDYQISETKLEAFVVMKSEPFEALSTHNLKNWIRLAGIKFGIASDAEITDFLSSGQVKTTFLIARGIPPEQGRDGSLELLFDREEVADENRQSSRQPPLVKKGEVIARRTPPIQGTPGRNVFGELIPPNKVDPAFPEKGKGVESVDNISYIATLDGHPALYRNRTLFVTPLPLEAPLSIINGDVQEDTGDQYRTDTVEILGSVCPGAVIHCRELRVWKNILGRVVVSGNVDVKGTVGNGSSQVMPGDSQASIQALGNVVVNSHIENATITTNGRVQAQGGDIISSTIQAQRGIFAKNICSGAQGVCTLGIGRRETGELAEINKHLGQKKSALRTPNPKTDQQEIDRLKREISALNVEKDYLLMEQERDFKPLSPEIKVKNKIEKGTLIKGERAALVVKQTMYGVKLHEADGQSKPVKREIVVQGYFE